MKSNERQLKHIAPLFQPLFMDVFNFFRRWSPTEGESFELIGIVSGGFRFADNLYAFIAHEEVVKHNQNLNN